MAGLVEGLDDAVQAELGRVIAELRQSLVEGPYNLGTVASLANINERTLRAILNGENFPRFDTLAKLMLILGVRMDLTRLEQRPLWAVPAVPGESQVSTGSRRSSHQSGASEQISPAAKSATDDLSAQTKSKPKRTASTQRGSRPSRKGQKRKCVRPVIDLRILRETYGREA